MAGPELRVLSQCVDAYPRPPQVLVKIKRRTVVPWISAPYVQEKTVAAILKKIAYDYLLVELRVKLLRSIDDVPPCRLGGFRCNRLGRRLFNCHGFSNRGGSGHFLLAA